MRLKPRIKICCITTPEDAALAISFGASALGFVSAMPSGPAIISDDLARALVATVPPGVASFLLTSRQTAGEIIQQQRYVRANTLQIVDRLREGSLKELRDALPGVSLVQVVHVHDASALDTALDLEPQVDGLLLDSGGQAQAVRQFGGTGRTHDWEISRRIVAAVKKPVFLAGGLRPENVGDAVDQVAPFGVDVCSGVRTEGRLDEQKLAAFFASCGAA